MQGQRRKYLSKVSICKLLFCTVLLLLFKIAAKAEVNDDDMLILEPVVQKVSLKEYTYAFEAAGKVYISLPEMSLYTGLKYKLTKKRLSLWLANEENAAVEMNLAGLTIKQPNQQPQKFALEDMLVIDDTLFFSETLWAEILKSDVTVDKLNMRLILNRDKDFPTIAKIKAEDKRAKGLYDISRDSFKNYEFDNRWFGAPVVDLSLSKGWSHSKSTHKSYNNDSYAMNVAMLAAGLDVEAYVSGESYNDHKPRVRLSGSRTFLDEPANALNLKTLKIGDLTGLNSSYFANQGFGRGAAVSSFKNLVMSADKTIDITGSLQEGWQVELYWNNQLIGFRQNGVAGQYNFPNIPVSYGLNTFNLVFYGPYGETYTETKRYYSGTSPVSKGEFGYNLSAYQPYRYLFESNEPFVYEGKDIPVLDMTGYYGATDDLTLMGGFTQTPDAKDGIETQRFAMTGAQMAVLGSSIQYNLEQNLDTKNYGHHAEWQGDVYIGNIYMGYDKYNKIHSPLSFYGTEYLDSQLETRFSGILPYSIPYYLSYREGKLEESGEKFSNYSARVSKQITPNVNWTLEDNYYNSHYSENSYNTIRNSIYTWNGKYTTQTWFEYETTPEQRFTEFSTRVDWRSGRNTYLSLQYRRDLKEDMDYLSFSGGQVYSFGGLNATIETDRDFNISAYLTYNISFAKEPSRNRLIKTGATKLSQRGTIYAEVYDENNEPIEGVGLNANGLEKQVYTDSEGKAVLTDLQTYERVIVAVDKETLPDISLQAKEDYKKLVLNPGTVRTIRLPFVHRGAIEGKLENPTNSRMFGYRIFVVDDNNEEKGETFADIEGTFILDAIPYGTYTLKVEKDGNPKASIENIVVNDAAIFMEEEIKLPPSEKIQLLEEEGEEADVDAAEPLEDIEFYIYEDPPYLDDAPQPFVEEDEEKEEDEENNEKQLVETKSSSNLVSNEKQPSDTEIKENEEKQLLNTETLSTLEDKENQSLNAETPKNKGNLSFITNPPLPDDTQQTAGITTIKAGKHPPTISQCVIVNRRITPV